MPLVGVVMGSSSDEPLMQETSTVLEQMGIEHEMVVMSAHRTPEKVMEYGQTARSRGSEAIIAARAALRDSPAYWRRGLRCPS